MTTSQCEFSKKLFDLQLDSNLLTEEEFRELEEHLSADPICPHCKQQILTTSEVFHAAEEILGRA